MNFLRRASRRQALADITKLVEASFMNSPGSAAQLDETAPRVIQKLWVFIERLPRARLA